MQAPAAPGSGLDAEATLRRANERLWKGLPRRCARHDVLAGSQHRGRRAVAVVPDPHPRHGRLRRLQRGDVDRRASRLFGGPRDRAQPAGPDRRARAQRADAGGRAAPAGQPDLGGRSRRDRDASDGGRAPRRDGAAGTLHALSRAGDPGHGALSRAHGLVPGQSPGGRQPGDVRRQRRGEEPLLRGRVRARARRTGSCRGRDPRRGGAGAHPRARRGGAGGARDRGARPRRLGGRAPVRGDAALDHGAPACRHHRDGGARQRRRNGPIRGGEAGRGAGAERAVRLRPDLHPAGEASFRPRARGSRRGANTAPRG